MLQRVNARNAVIDDQKYKRFLGENPQTRPSYFPHKSLTCCGNGTEGKIGASEEIRVEEPNILCCLKYKFKYLYIFPPKILSALSPTKPLFFHLYAN
jgi:hypothetical protein